MASTCTIEGCDKKVNARGLCGGHYQKAQRAGLFGNPCSIEGCNKHRVGGGLCETHYAQVWREENREKYNKTQRNYMKTYVFSPELKAKCLANGEKYRRNNLAKFADKERVRRGVKRGNGGSYTRKDWIRLLNRHNGLCAYCKDRKATTADHVIPLAKGGTNFIGNILPACVPCNSSKQDTSLFKWRIQNERKINRTCAA